MTNYPTRGLVPIGTADEIARATEAILPPSMEKVDVDGERFELSDHGTSGIPVWSQPCVVRGVPNLNSLGFMLQLIVSIPMQPSGGKLLIRLTDLTLGESARLVQHAHAKTPVEMRVAIARGKGRTLLGAPARETPVG